MAIASMTEAILAAGHELHLLCMSTHKHPFRASDFPQEVSRNATVDAVHVNTEMRPFAALQNLFSSRSYNLQRFMSPAVTERLVQTLKRNTFDVIHLESLYCAQYIPLLRKWSRARIVVRTHNVEYRIWQQLARHERNPLKQWYLNLLSERLKQHEPSILKQADGLIHITKEDDATFREMGVTVPSTALPIGLDLQQTMVQPAAELALYHLGAMDWQPNVEGVEWFVNEAWPLIHSRHPKLRCFLAGRHMPKHLLEASTERLVVRGEVSDAASFMQQANIAIIPLFSGSGLRVKIVEAMAHGKTVITTELGGTGIPYTAGTDLLIADSAQAFADRIDMLIDRPEKVSQIGRAARQLAERHFDQLHISSELDYFYHQNSTS